MGVIYYASATRRVLAYTMQSNAIHDGWFDQCCILWRWLATVCLTLSTSSMAAEPPPSSARQTNVAGALPVTGGAHIECAAPVHDFGKLLAGKVMKHEFVITNTGDTVLEISEVKRSCGCTATGEWSRRVEPGQTGRIPIEYHSANDRGSVTKSVTVVSTAANQSNFLLSIKADVWRPFELKPETAVLKVMADSGSNVVATVRILNQLDRPITLSEPRSSHTNLAGELRELVAGKEYDLAVRLVPPMGLGNVFGKISLKTTSAEFPELEIPAYALLQPSLQVSPHALILPGSASSNRTTRIVSIRAAAAKPLALSEPTLNVPGSQIHLKEVEPGRYYAATLSFPPGYVVPSDGRVEFKINSNYADTPVIRVPIIRSGGAAPARPATSAPPAPASPGRPPTS